MTPACAVRPARLGDAAAWSRLRLALWPDAGEAAHRADLEDLLAHAGRAAGFLAWAGDLPVGFAEASLRTDYVNGTAGSPVAFLEGLYVDPPHRRRGVGRALVAAVEAWARARGVAELASDAALDNAPSHAAHAAYGFAEAERVVCFVKRLA